MSCRPMPDVDIGKVALAEAEWTTLHDEVCAPRAANRLLLARIAAVAVGCVSLRADPLRRIGAIGFGVGADPAKSRRQPPSTHLPLAT